MKRVFTDYVQDILEAVTDIETFVSGHTYEEFAADKKTLYAVIRSLEVIGEAAKKIPEDLRSQFGDIPWRQMAGMRDKLIHEYHGVDSEIIWAVATQELPSLKPALLRLRASLDQ